MPNCLWNTSMNFLLLVLKYVQNKDVFMRYHKAHLTRRLILDSSADSEKEENMVEWLRDVGMPADYVNKLARMFQDVKVSEDLNQHFKDVHRNKGSLADSINIKILNAGAWARGSERVQVSLPLELEDFIPEVEEFYRQKHNGRKLQWYHHMSNGTITFSNNAGKFDLDITTFQMAVLFAWNQRPNDRISFENLKLATELPDAELRRTLWSLVAFPKLKRQVLVYSPEAKSPKDFDDSTLFWVNQEFSLMFTWWKFIITFQYESNLFLPESYAFQTTSIMEGKIELPGGPSELDLNKERLAALKEEYQRLCYEIKKKEFLRSSSHSKIQQQIRLQWKKINELKRLQDSESFANKGNKNLEKFHKLLDEMVKLEEQVKKQNEEIEVYEKKSLTKYNQLLIANNALREDIVSLLQTQAAFRKQYNNIKHLISSGKKTVTEIVQSATTSYQTGKCIPQVKNEGSKMKNLFFHCNCSKFLLTSPKNNL